MQHSLDLGRQNPAHSSGQRPRALLRPRLLGCLLAGCLAAGLVVQPASVAAQGGAPPPTSPAVSSVLDQYGDLVWVDRSTSLLRSGVSAIAISPTSPDLLFAGGRGFVAVSENGGTSWRPSLLLISTELAESGEDQLLIQVDDNDLERFDDTDALEEFSELREQLFEELESVYGEDLAEQLILEAEADLREEAFADLLDESAESGLELSFQARFDRLISSGFAEDEALKLAQDPLAVYDIYINPESPEIIYVAAGLGLFRSNDAGRTWQRLLSGFNVDGLGVLSVASDLNGARIVAGTARGVRVSLDAGRTWRPSIGEVSTDPIRAVATSSSRDRFYALGSRQIYVTEDAGTTWAALRPTQFSADEANDLLTVDGMSATVYVATERGVFRSDDAGSTWSPLAPIPDRVVRDIALAAPNSDQNMVAVSERSVYVSTDTGKTWRDASAGLFGQSLLEIDLSDGGANVFLGGSNGLARGVLGMEAALEAETLRELETIWQSEPSPAETLTAALIHNELAEIESHSWNGQLVASKFVPDVRVRVRYVGQREDREYFDFEAPDRDVLRVDRPSIGFLNRQHRDTYIRESFEWEIHAVFDLGRLIYHPAENTIETAVRQLERTRRKMLARIIRTYIERRANQLKIALEGTTTIDERVHAILEIEESTALLDGLTGGYFTRANGTN